jgi:toxin ParE1/3/4
VKESKPWRPTRLAAAAEADFEDILSWTADHFGEPQARAYAEVLTDAFAALAAGSTTFAKARNDIAPRLFSLHVARDKRKGRHFIIFRVGQIENREIIEILRILHDSMDLARHLPPRALSHLIES